MFLGTVEPSLYKIKVITELKHTWRQRTSKYDVEIQREIRMVYLIIHLLTLDKDIIFHYSSVNNIDLLICIV